MTEFSSPSLDLKNITSKPGGRGNLNIVTDKGIQRTYLTAIKINHKMIRICKTDNYSYHSSIYCSVYWGLFSTLCIQWISIVKSWPFADCINLHSFWKMNQYYHWWLTSPNLVWSFIHEKYLSKTNYSIYITFIK